MSPKRKSGASKSKAKPRPKKYRRIATEEAFAIPEQMEAQRELVANAQEYDPDLFLWRIANRSKRAGSQQTDRSV